MQRAHNVLVMLIQCAAVTLSELFMWVFAGEKHVTAVFFFLSFSHFTSQAEASRPDVVLVLVNGVGSF